MLRLLEICKPTRNLAQELSGMRNLLTLFKRIPMKCPVLALMHTRIPVHHGMLVASSDDELLQEAPNQTTPSLFYRCNASEKNVIDDD
jgi:hypothetical protein